jgi:predicted enzyme related to lactoylglutathione lyase
MARVTGIGGVFIRAKDPDALRQWYATHLGLDFDPSGSVLMVRHQENDAAIWNSFAQDTGYFGPGTQQVMMNYRVDDLDALVVARGAAGIAQVKQGETSEFGQFAWIVDPEGNRIELWQPPAGL